MPEVYVSDCCGGVFAPGHGPDNIVEATEGTEVRRKVSKMGFPSDTYEIHEVNEYDARNYDAVRSGDCPSCGARFPGLVELSHDDLGGAHA